MRWYTRCCRIVLFRKTTSNVRGVHHHEERYTVVSLKKPVEKSDPLTGLLREGAQQLLYGAVEAELAEYLSQYQAERDASGRRCVVRNGYLPARTVMTGLGEVRTDINVIAEGRCEAAVTHERIIRPFMKEHSHVSNPTRPWVANLEHCREPL